MSDEPEDRVEWRTVEAAHESWHGPVCNGLCEVMEFARRALAPASLRDDREATLLTDEALDRLAAALTYAVETGVDADAAETRALLRAALHSAPDTVDETTPETQA